MAIRFVLPEEETESVAFAYSPVVEVVLSLHSHPDDWDATRALTLLNKALVEFGWKDPFDWKVRWSQRRKP